MSGGQKIKVKGTVVDLEKLHNCVHEVVNDLERVAHSIEADIKRVP